MNCIRKYGKISSLLILKNTEEKEVVSIYAPINSNFNTPPPRQSPGIWTFEDCMIQIPTLSGQNSVEMPYPIVEFVFQEPLSEYMIIAVSDFSAKKKLFETLHFLFNFPHPAETKVKFPTPRAKRVVKCPWFARGCGGCRSITLISSIFASI